jgi:hypothetical protein
MNLREREANSPPFLHRGSGSENKGRATHLVLIELEDAIKVVVASMLSRKARLHRVGTEPTTQ